MKYALIDKSMKSFSRILNFVRLKFAFIVLRDGFRLSTLRSPPSYVSEYYEYCVRGILGAVGKKAGGSLAIFFSNQTFRHRRDTKTVMINVEHTLVRKNGRDSAGSLVGNIPVGGTASVENYLVRIPGGAQNLSTADQIIDYSIPNTMNVLNSEHRSLYLHKAHYISPLLSPIMLNPSSQGRDLDRVFTLMSLPKGGDRRSGIIDALSHSGLETVNISGLFGDTSKRMSQIGILLNLHQTDHHHTLEELRILPALLQGVLVVSEPSPLTDRVPFSHYMTFATVDELPKVLSEIMENYDSHWEKTFASGDFTKTVSSIEKSNIKAFKDLVGKLKL
jgi:hypothetical protein